MDADTILKEVRALRKEIKEMCRQQLSSTPIYTIKQTCILTGTSRQKLKQVCLDKRLPVPSPVMTKGATRPLYSDRDIAIIKRALIE